MGLFYFILFYVTTFVLASTVHFFGRSQNCEKLLLASSFLPAYQLDCPSVCKKQLGSNWTYEGWNFNSGNYLFTTDTK